jgi:FAD dependent oxidoreductase TIGR03364
VWSEVAGPAGIAIVHSGLLVTARRPEAVAVLEEFAATEMGEGCRVLCGDDLRASAPMLARSVLGGLHSPHELRVESRTAVPLLRSWLAREHRVRFLPRVAATVVEPGRVRTSGPTIVAPRIVVCPGSDLVSLFPDIAEKRGVTLCKLHMLRLASPGYRVPGALMGDLGLVRYRGYAGCASLGALRARLVNEQPAELADGIHLIVVQAADGSLVVGDSHHYAESPDPFQPGSVDDRIIGELEAITGSPAPRTIERWTGTYASGSSDAFVDAPLPGVRFAMVTSGTGASTAFGIAEETIADLLELPAPVHVEA